MFHPFFALIDMPIILVVVAAAALLFGADKLPKLARSAGQAKKEFMMGQIEADEATAKAREEARLRARSSSAATEEAEPPADHGTGT